MRPCAPTARLLLLVPWAILLSACGTRSAGVVPRVGVAPSPRVVADGQPVPRGGGRAVVGRPYMIGGRTFVPRHHPTYASVGIASWYGDAFHGRLTANGEVFDRDALSAAHPTMPLPSYARVTNLENGRSVVLRVNDRGPFAGGERTVDVSRRAAEVLGFRRDGLTRVHVAYVAPAPLSGSDDRVLISSLRNDGRSAEPPGPQVRTASAGAVASISRPFGRGWRNVIFARSRRRKLEPGKTRKDSAILPEISAVDQIKARMHSVVRHGTRRTGSARLGVFRSGGGRARSCVLMHGAAAD
jgi:rare lipoprotein A (peptidoglycan hydrolase)